MSTLNEVIKGLGVYFSSQITAEAEMRVAKSVAGAANHATFGADLTGIAPNDLIYWSFTTGRKNILIDICIDSVAGNTFLGWFVSWNNGTREAARDKLSTCAGANNMAVYLIGGTVNQDTNKGGLILPGGSHYFPERENITDVCVMPVSSAATSVGNTTISVTVT